MRNIKRRIAAWISASLMVLAFLTGCAARQVSLSDHDAVKVEVIPAKDPYVRIGEAVNVYQEGSRLVVRGNVLQDRARFSSYKGHIDVAVIDPEGKLMKLETAEYDHFPSRRRFHSFKVRFHVVAERGTKVRMVFHSLRDGDSEHLAAVERLIDKGILIR